MPYLLLLILICLQNCIGSDEHTLIELTWSTHPEYGGYTHCRITIGPLFKPPLAQIEGDFYQLGRAEIALTSPEVTEPPNRLFVLRLYFHDQEEPSYCGMVFIPEDCTPDSNFRYCQAILKEVV